MKKLLTLALTFVMLVGSTLNVMAEDSTLNITEMEIPITYTQPSSYSIYIPESIDMSSGEYTFTANILDITSEQKVKIKQTEQVHLTSEDGDVSQIWLRGSDGNDENNVAVFERGNNTSLISMVAQFDGSAGTYSGTATFTIVVE